MSDEFKGIKCLVDTTIDPAPTYRGIFRDSHPDPRWFRTNATAEPITAENIEAALKRCKEMIERSNEKPDMATANKATIRRLYDVSGHHIPDHIKAILDDDSISDETVFMFAR